jgi:OFA family oxalate/formate antiporter-like MFS transporter
MGYRVLAVIIAGFSTVFVSFGIRYSYGLLLPEMLSDLAISKTDAGVIYSSYFFTFTVCSPLLGLLADRLDARAILTIFVGVLGMGAYFMSLATTVIQASIFFAVAGIGHSACWAPVMTVAVRWVSEKRRGIVLSIVDLGSAISIAFWSAVIPLIIGAYRWRMVWVSLGLASFLAAGMNFLLIRSHPPFEVEPQGSGSASKAQIQIKAAYTAILRDKKFYLIGFSYMLISFSILIPFVFLPAYVTQELMIPYTSAAVLVAVIGVAGAIGKLILGYISDIVGRIKVMMLCGVLTAVGGLGLAYAQNLIMLVFFASVFGVGYGTIWPVYAASARDLFSKDYYGSILGLWQLFHGLGSMLAPVSAGWVIDTTGTYVWAFILTVISGAISSLLLLPLAKRTSVEFA